MTESDLLQTLARGEDSRHQFKRDATNADGMAAELAALANSGGGTVFLGVADDGSFAGLDAAAVRRLNQLISNAASQHVRPPLHPHRPPLLLSSFFCMSQLYLASRPTIARRVAVA